MYNGYTKIRSGIKEHISSGKLRGNNLQVYLFLILYAEYDKGYYWGNQESVRNTLGISQDAVNKAFTFLKRKKYIFYKVSQGFRGFYETWINRYDLTAGAYVGKRINAYPDNGLKCPVYEDAVSEAEVVPKCFVSEAEVFPKSFLYYKTEDIIHKTEDIESSSSPAIEEKPMDDETKAKMKKCIQMWEAIGGSLKKPHVPKTYWTEPPDNSWFSLMRKFVENSDWEETWSAVCEEYSNSKFLKTGGGKGIVTSIGWVFQDNGVNMAKVLSGKYHDKEQFLDKPQVSEHTAEKLKEDAVGTGMKFA